MTGTNTSQSGLQKAKELIKAHEGMREKMYLDNTGHYTIGFGHNLQFMPISENACNVILDDDLQWFAENLPKHLPWVNNLSAERYAVMLDMAFNLGIMGLLRFKKFLNYMADGKYLQAADEMLDSIWARQVGTRAVHDANIIRTGKI